MHNKSLSVLLLLAGCLFFLEVASDESNEKEFKREKSADFQNKAKPIGPVVLITGASSGIGLNLVKQLLEDDTVLVIFASDFQKSEEIQKLTQEHSERNYKLGLATKIVEFLWMDVTRPLNIGYVMARLKSTLRRYAKFVAVPATKFAVQVNTLINNAGIMQTKKGVDPLSPDHDVYMRHMEVNAVGAALVTGFFHKIIPESMAGRIVFISSAVGSMNDFQGVRSHRNVAYGMSKAAMNYYMLSIDWHKRWMTMSICPGWVGTDMGNLVKSVEGGPQPTLPSVTAQRIVATIGAMDTKSSGKFVSLHFDEQKATEIKF